jgi:hypothetical protein
MNEHRDHAIEDKITHNGRFSRSTTRYRSEAAAMAAAYWLAAVVDVAVKRAAQLSGDHKLAHLSVLVPQMVMYRKPDRGEKRPAEAPITRSDTVDARQRPKNARPPFTANMGLFVLGLDKQSKGAESFEQPFEEFVKDRKHYRRQSVREGRNPALSALLGVNHFIMRVQWPGLKQVRPQTIPHWRDFRSDIGFAQSASQMPASALSR